MLLTGPRFHLTTTSGSGVTFVEETFVEEIFADFIFVIYDLIQKNLFQKNIENDTSYKNLYDFKKKKIVENWTPFIKIGSPKQCFRVTESQK